MIHEIEAFYGAVQRDLIVYGAALGGVAVVATIAALLQRQRFLVALAITLALGALALGGAAASYISSLPNRSQTDVTAIREEPEAAIPSFVDRYSPERTVPHFRMLLGIWAAVAGLPLIMALIFRGPITAGVATAAVLMALASAVLDASAHLRDRADHEFWTEQVARRA
jgi:hypothetical protein